MNPETDIPKPNMANTPAEMEEMVQKALGRLTTYRMEAWFPKSSVHLERFIHDVMTGEI